MSQLQAFRSLQLMFAEGSSYQCVSRKCPCITGTPHAAGSKLPAHTITHSRAIAAFLLSWARISSSCMEARIKPTHSGHNQIRFQETCCP